MKKVFSSIIIFMLGIFMMTNIYAISSINAKVSSSVEEIRENQNLTIILKFDNYEDIGKGIYSYKATLEYDENIFEEVEPSDFIGLNDWSEIYYNKATKEFIAIKRAGSMQAEEIMEINLKVKENANSGITMVGIKDIVCSDGKKDIEINNDSIEIEIVKTSSENSNNTDNSSTSTMPDDTNNSSNNTDNSSASTMPDDTNNSSNNTDNSNTSTMPDDTNNSSNNTDNSNASTMPDDTNNSSNNNGDSNNTDNSSNSNNPNNADNSNSSSNVDNPSNSNNSDNSNQSTNLNNNIANKQDSDIYSGVIPKTGSNYFKLFTLILIEIVFAIVSFIRYQRTKKELNESQKIKPFVMICCTIIISTQFFGAVYTSFAAFSSKGELNNDDDINYSDANMLEKHLIHLENLPEDKLENADMNSDGYLTVTDLSLIVQKIENLLEYEVNLSDIEVDNYYPTKNEEITLSFTANTNYDSYIKTVTINNNEYAVEQSNNKYSVKLNTGNESGTQEFKITKVLLNTGKEIDTDYTTKIMVLKNEPTIENYKLDENVNGKVYISFDLNDEENSISSAQITISEQQENSAEEIVLTQNIEKGNNTIELPVQDEQNYQVKIIANYDLAQEQLTEYKENHTGILEIQKEFKATVDYKFQISDIKTFNAEKETQNFEKNETIKLEFTSTNVSDFVPEKAIVNGEEYNVTRIDNTDTYQVELSGFDKPGEKELKLENIILNNKKSFDVSDDNKIQIEVLKDIPQIEEVKQEDDFENNIVNVISFIIDPDKAYISGKVQLIKPAIAQNDSNNANSTEELLKEVDIEKGEDGNCTISFNNLDENVEYIARFIITYNRHIETQEETMTVEEKIELLRDYKLQVSNVKTFNTEKETQNFEKNEAIKVEFTSTNASVFDVKKATINGKEYKLTKENDKYTATIDGFTEIGEKSITIENITLENGKEFMLEKDNSIIVTVNKLMPSITNFESEESISDKNIKVKFNVEDEDNTIQSAKVVIYNGAGNVIESKEITSDEIATGVIEKTLKTEKSDKYTVKVIANYQITDLIEDSILFEKEINAKVYATIEGAILSKSCVEKSEAITITYTIDTNSQKEISEICTNNVNYVTTKLDNGDYKININAANTAGEQVFNTTKVIFADKTEAEVKNELKVDVLKDIPQVKKIQQEDDLANDIFNITASIIDLDKAYVSGKVQLIKQNTENTIANNSESNATNKEEVLQEVDIKNGEDGNCTVSFNSLDENETYIARFIIIYNRHIENKEDKKETMNVEEKINLVRDYKLQVSNIKTFNSEKETQYFEKNEEIKLVFSSTNASIFEAKKATINGKEYTLTKENDKYIATIDGFNEAGEKTINIENITLENGKIFTLEKANSITIKINKSIPSITNFESEESISNKNIKVKFNIEDNDNTIQSAKIEIYNGAGNVIDSKEITSDEIANGTIEKTLKTAKTDKYTVKVIANYQIIDLVENGDLFDKEIEAKIYANITNAVLNKTCAEKGENITATYTIDTNSQKEISEICINNVNYVATKLSDGNYGVNLISSDTAGEQIFDTTKVIFADKTEAEVQNELKVDILKDIPQIEEIKQVDDLSSDIVKIIFTIEDPDKAYISGKVQLIKPNTVSSNLSSNLESNSTNKEEVLQEVNIQKGEDGNYVVTFNSLDEDIVYTAKFLITYNRHIKTNEDEKETMNVEEKIELVRDYKLQVSDIKTSNTEKETQNFGKNESIKVSFTSTNASVFEAKKAIINNKEYALTKENNKYFAVIDGFNEAGEKTITIESVILENGRKLALESNNDITVTINKEMPTVKNFEAEENSDGKNIKVQFDIEDKDNAIKSAKIAIYDSEGNIVESREVTLNEIAGGTIEKTLKTENSGNYTIKIIADYQVAELVEDEVLYSQEIGTGVYANITKVVPSKTEVEKGEGITIAYTIDTNSQEPIVKVRVDNVEYDATKTTSGDYEITLNASNTAGEQTIKTTEVIFNDRSEKSVENEVKIEVLKEKPQIEEIKQEDDYTIDSVSIDFSIIDVDKVYKSGKVQLIKLAVTDNSEDSTEEILKEVEIKKEAEGNCTVDFGNLKESEKYIARFIITYNRYIEDKEETLVVEKEIQLVDDYKLQVSNIKTYNKEKEIQYFEKNEAIKLEFTSTNISEFQPEKVIINEKEYVLTRVDNTDTYQFDLPGFDTAGEKEIEIQTIILSNKKYVNISKDNKVKVEVLKEAPTVVDFSYQPIDAQITAKFEIVDTDNAIKNVNAIITDENNAEIKNVELNANSSEVTFNQTGSSTYNIKIIANYDLDTNAIESGKNEYKDQILLDQKMDSELRLVEMKDITNITLYKIENDTVSEIQTIRDTDLANITSYIAKVEMKDMPAFYSTIKGYALTNETVNDRTGVKSADVEIKLNYDSNVIQYDGDKSTNEIVIPYTTITGRSIIEGTKQSFDTIIEQLNTYPSGSITLTSDIDATGYTALSLSSPALVTSSFSGTFDGNGHTIYNLSATLFDELSGATIKNLVIEDAVVEAKQDSTNSYILTTGVIANEATNATFSNVHIKNSRLTTCWVSSGYGMLVGSMQSGNVSNCSATNIVIKGDGVDIGGLVGKLTSGNITNSYVTGSLEYNATSDIETSNIGGIVGNVENKSNISYNIAKVELASVSGPNCNGGIIGSASSATTLIGNVSLATGSSAYRLTGSVASSSSSNNYELAESTLPTNTSYNYIKEVSKDNITADFFENTVKLNTNIWNLEYASYDNLPSLKNLDPNNQNREYGETSNLYIPDYDRVSNLAEFNSNKKIAYSNMYKLMPFYDAKYLVEDGNKISENDILNTKFIKSVLAYDSNHNLLVDIATNNYESIATIKIIFTDDTSKEYKVKFKNYYANVVSYIIEELNVQYNYDKFVLKQDAKIVDELVNYIKNINYSSELSGLVQVQYGGRIYRDYFNDTVKANAKDFILKYLENTKIGAIVSDDENIAAVLRNKLITNGGLKQSLFAYNYYSRWYDIDIDGAKISDIMLFKNNIYGNTMGIDNLTLEIMKSKWVNSPHNKYFYRDNIGPRTRYYTVGEFIDYNVITLGHYTNPDDWFTDSFKGILYEAPAKDHPEIEYRAWTQLKKNDTYLLALLTIPENSGYMVSFPTQFLVGSVSIYGVDANTESGRNEIFAKMKSFGDNFATMYNTTAGFIDAKYLNNVCDIEIDRTGGGVEINEKTTDPFIKNFNEALYEWREITMGGQGAYGQDGKIVWVVFSALNDFNDATHETGHVQASKIFMENKGRRSGTTNTIDEDYPDGNIRQSFGDGSANFNLTFTFGTDSNITTNLTPERINTREKIESYYKEMFETIDFLDYAEAKAFLQLTPEEQSKVAVQVYYPRTEVEGYDSSKAKASDYLIVGWRTLTADQFKEMNLQTIEDLYNNKITIKPGVTSNSTLSGEAGSYGYEGIYVRHWYQPHNDYSRTYSYGLKATAWEMLGVGGYEGYVNYYSGASANDLIAIRKVTGDNTMTWKKYKLGRYELMENNWENISYIDSDKLVEEYVKALKTDAQNGDRSVSESTNVRRANYHYLKRVTNDFRVEVFGSEINEIHITSAEEFIEKISENQMGYFVLDNDIDFSTKSTSSTIIQGTFSGYLNGNGHKITGNTAPIFNSIKYAYISNLQIEGSQITSTSNDIGALARNAIYSKIENIIGNNIKVTSTGNEIGGLVGKIDKITLININITESSVSGNKDVGGIVGSVSNSTIEDITGSNITVTSTGNETGGFIGIMSNSKLSNINITDANVSGSARVGGIAGYVGNTTIENSSSNGAITSVGNASGGFVGEIINSTNVKNCYAIGTVNGNQDIGGFVGYANNSSVTNCFAYVIVTGKQGAVGSAGFIGQAVGNSTIANNISLRNQNTSYKFDGRTAADQFSKYSNNYEYEENKGISTLTRTGIDFTGKISVVSKADYITEAFFTNTLGWDSNIWDLSGVADEKLPKLKDSSFNLDKGIFNTYTVSNADEFIEKLTADPEGVYIINNDIDFSEKTYNLGSTVIQTTFEGKVLGNNHTISNLTNATLFNEFAGKVYDLNISNFKYSVATMIYQGKEIIFRNNSYNDTTNASAFAKTTTNATLSNIKFDKIVIFAREYIGIVSAKDTNSTFDRISVTDSYVEGRSQSNGGGQCTSMFIGKASGSKVTNCYVQGELRYYQANKTAAVIGEATNVTVDKVISDVTIPYYFNDIASGFIGAFTNDTTSKVTNSVVLGDIDVTNGVGRRKFVASSNGTDDTAINQVILRIFENCYENSDSIGTSNSNETTKNNIKTQSKEKFEDKDFYINTLGFDETIWNLENINNLKKYNRYQTYITVETTEIVDIGLK